MIYLVVTLVATRLAAVCFHEGAHAAIARLLGYSSSTSISLTGLSHTTVPGIDKTAAFLVRNAGWIASVVLAIVAFAYCLQTGPLAVLFLTAFDGVYTDLFHGVEASSVETFFCGNFGLLLLDKAAAPLIKKMLETSIRVTMMRGAQSAGVITYVPKGKGTKGIRKRVVNGKRTDLCDILMAKFGSQMKESAVKSPQLFQGHTRFATTSIAAMPGCHPHQFSPPADRNHWTQVRPPCNPPRISPYLAVSH